MNRRNAVYYIKAKYRVVGLLRFLEADRGLLVQPLLRWFSVGVKRPLFASKGE